ncbi:hypothetical protein CCP3SC15_1390005 [Gammaproteobacteria bacterium]
MIILRTAQWRRRMGYRGAGPAHAVAGQLTVINWRGHTAYVRENYRSLTFYTSSNARLGIAGGGRRGKNLGQLPADAQQILELAAPAPHWQTIADLVHQADAHHRPVVRSHNFTIPTAQYLLRLYDGQLSGTIAG